MNNKNWKRNFYVMWAGQTVSVLTSSILQMALIWYITQISGSALMLSLASIAGYLPSAVLGLFAGTLVDRVQRKVAVIGADLFIAAVSLALVLVSLSGQLPVWIILVVLAMRSIGTAFHTPAISAATPLIVPADQLTKCAGMTQALQTIGNIAGIAAAGVLYPICSMSTLVMFDVGGAVVASIATALIAIPSHLDTDVPQKKKNLLHETLEGYQILKNDRGLFALTWTAALFMIIWSPLGALFPLMSLDVFGGTTVQASIDEITFSVGILV